MITRRMPRVQEVVLPLLRASLPNDVTVGSWMPDVDRRQLPYVHIRRLGGISANPDLLDKPVIEMTCYHDDNLEACEALCMDARAILYRAVEAQTLTDAGYLHSYFETLGPTQFDSPIEDSWRVQCLIQLGVRPRRD